MHDPADEMYEQDAEKGGRRAESTSVVTDSLVTTRSLGDSTGDWGSSNSSESNTRQEGPRPPPRVVHVTHQHDWHRKQGNICPRAKPVNDADRDEASLRRDERPNVRHDCA